MKARFTGLVLLFVALLASLTFASRTKTTIILIEPVLVGSVTLQPGEYTVTWTGAGPEVQVSFSQGKNTIVTLPAKLEPGHNEPSVTTNDLGSGRVLVEIDCKDTTLLFGE